MDTETVFENKSGQTNTSRIAGSSTGLRARIVASVYAGPPTSLVYSILCAPVCHVLALRQEFVFCSDSTVVAAIAEEVLWQTASSRRTLKHTFVARLDFSTMHFT
jgi:hypothetical protein